jgi:hypothetical protein
MKVAFMDSGRQPQCKPNPAHPHGMHVDLSHSASRTCQAALPYPAPRWSVMVVECAKWGLRIGVTVLTTHGQDGMQAELEPKLPPIFTTCGVFTTLQPAWKSTIHRHFCDFRRR